jgi:hypothetical protein
MNSPGTRRNTVQAPSSFCNFFFRKLHLKNLCAITKSSLYFNPLNHSNPNFGLYKQIKKNQSKKEEDISFNNITEPETL